MDNQSEEPINYFREESEIEILEISSEIQGCPCVNILKDERKVFSSFCIGLLISLGDLAIGGWYAIRFSCESQESEKKTKVF